jgi:2',3'-cyclic-nucleotide 2'-phosphodiesterase (5'-nucleotidase family)
MFRTNLYRVATILTLFISAISCYPSYKVIDYKSSNEIVITDFSTTDSLFLLINQYKIQLDTLMNEVLNTTLVDLEIGNPEGLLGNFVADLVLQRGIRELNKIDPNLAPLDFCVLNNGGLRKPLLKGTITRADIYEVMPFENELVVIEMKGIDIHRLVQYIVTKSTLSDARKAGVPISGMRLIIQDSIASEVRIGLHTLNSEKTYHIITSDYLANGGDNMDFFSYASKTIPLGIKLRDAILEEVISLGKSGHPINAQIDGRIQLRK